MEGSLMTMIAYEATGIDALVTVTFNAAPGATTLSSGTVAVDAINTKTKTKYASTTATIQSGTTIRFTFGEWVLPEGTYEVQVRAPPSGYSTQTLSLEDSTFQVRKSAAVQA